MLRANCFALMIALFCCASDSFADGKVFGEKPFAKIDIPDQQAIITYLDGTEKLIIETHFTGEGKNFAWIVPLPSEPQIEAVSPGVFKTIPNLFGPEVIDDIPFVAGHVFIIWLILMLAILYYTGRMKNAWFGLPLLFYVLSFMTIAGGLGEGSKPSANVKLLKSQTVGSYTASVLSAKTADDLLLWLKENKYYVPDEFKPAADHYVKKGWIFVAIKMRNENENKNLSVHPLSFTFKTEKAIYPMRMTAVDNKRTSVNLYVFGKERASIEGFTLERCGQINRGNFNRLPEDIYVKHPALEKITAECATGTLLSANLSKEQMMVDFEIKWKPFNKVYEIYYTKAAAGIISLNWVVTIFLLILTVIIYLRGEIVNIKPLISSGKALLIIGIMIVAAILCFNFIHSMYPTIKTTTINRFYSNDVLDCAMKLQSTPVNEMTIDRLRAEAQKYLSGKKNIYTDEPLKEEDSPGNYIIRQKDGMFEIVKYGFAGEEESYQINSR